MKELAGLNNLWYHIRYVLQVVCPNSPCQTYFFLMVIIKNIQQLIFRRNSPLLGKVDENVTFFQMEYKHLQTAVCEAVTFTNF